MDIYYAPKFARQYKKLPRKVQEAAEQRERLFRKSPFDPKLETHKLTGPLSGFWAFSITNSYRIIFEFVDDNTVRFYRIGSHDIYNV